MKHISLFFALVLVVLLTGSCSKDDPYKVTYEVTVSAAAAFTAKYTTTGDGEASEAVNGLTWSKTVTIEAAGGAAPTVARLVLLPPALWANTTNTANVSLHILVDGEEKARTEEAINASHVNVGLYALASF